MKERPILFSGPMVRAILDGRKTQTRRVVKPQPVMSNRCGIPFFQDGSPVDYRLCPHGSDGDRLWVRETFRFDGIDHRIGMAALRKDDLSFRADMETDRSVNDCPWRPSIFMPRWASRITLEIVSVRVERLQEISEEDAKAEGIDPLFTEEKISDRPDLAECRGQWANYLWHGHFGKFGLGSVKSDRWTHQFSSYSSAVGSYSSLWESINGPGSWDANPWVWVIEFRRVKP